MDRADTVLLVVIVGASCFAMPVLIAAVAFMRRKRREKNGNGGR